LNILQGARILLLTALPFLAPAVHADVGIPALTAQVTDATATLTDSQRAELEQVIQEFEAKKGSQISVLLVRTTQPETIEQYSMRVVEQWKIGRKGIDDGVLLIVAKDDRAVRIEVGYGLEGVLTDATSDRIINETILPRFRQGDFYGGISAGVGSITQVIDGEALPAPQSRRTSGGGSPIASYLPILFVLCVMAGGVCRALLGRLPGAVVTGGAVAVVAWLLSGTLLIAVVAGVMALLFTLLGTGIGAYVGGRAIGAGPGRFGSDSGRTMFRGGGGGFGGGASGRW
jgi:uncharacterized protein